MSQSPDPYAAVERVAELAPDAADLLCLCAFLDPAHPVPLAALDAGAGALPERLAAALADPAARERMFDALLDAGVGGVARGELVLRPAAAADARARLDADARRAWARTAVGVMEHAFPTDPTREEDREAAGRLLPHAVAAARHAVEEGTSPGPAAQLLYLAGRYLLEARSDFLAARELLKHAVAARERAHGAEDARVAFDLNYLNGALLHLGEWSEMAANATRAAGILEGELGPRDRTVITHVNNAALLLARAGHRERAREWFTRALELAEPVFGRVHPFRATILSNLGDLDRAEGDLHAAREAYRKALAIDEAAYGPRHNSVARDLAKLGEVLAETGDPAAARPLLERALAWITGTEGADDVRAAHLRAVLARLDGSPPQPPEG
jgi:tetratricopeptide (TPR) repeat protein